MNAVLQVARWVLAPLRNQTFFSVAEANRAVRERLEWLNDRPFSQLDGSRRSLWLELDRPALQPLPPRRFELPDWKPNVGVNIDYHVAFDHHYYSVPYPLVHQRVDVRATTTIVEIFHKGRRVASHCRSAARGRFTTDPAHRPESHRRYAEWSPARLIRWAETIGPETAALLGPRVLARKAASRAGLSVLPRHHPPRPALQRRAPGEGVPARPRPGRAELPQRRVDPQARARPAAAAPDPVTRRATGRARERPRRGLLPPRSEGGLP